MPRLNLKKARQERAMSQQQVAEYLGISVRMYQRIESGNSLGTIKQWDKMEDLFRIPQRTLRIVSTEQIVHRDIKNVGKG